MFGIFRGAGREFERELIRERGRDAHRDTSEGRTGTLKSLHQFVAEKWVDFAVRFDADLPALHMVEAEVRRGQGSERIRYRLLSLPLYLVERLPLLVEYLTARI